MEAFILIFGICFICLLLYIVNTKICNKTLRKPAKNFKLEVASDDVVQDYIDRMPLQYKNNERVLDGTGKMHYSEIVENGSKLVKNQNISVLKSIGERFS